MFSAILQYFHCRIDQRIRGWSADHAKMLPQVRSTSCQRVAGFSYNAADGLSVCGSPSGPHHRPLQTAVPPRWTGTLGINQRVCHAGPVARPQSDSLSISLESRGHRQRFPAGTIKLPGGCPYRCSITDHAAVLARDTTSMIGADPWQTSHTRKAACTSSAIITKCRVIVRRRMAATSFWCVQQLKPSSPCTGSKIAVTCFNVRFSSVRWRRWESRVEMP